jgi:hypothetical protein
VYLKTSAIVWEVITDGSNGTSLDLPLFWLDNTIKYRFLDPQKNIALGVPFNQALKLVVRYLRSFLKNVAQQD